MRRRGRRRRRELGMWMERRCEEYTMIKYSIDGYRDCLSHSSRRCKKVIKNLSNLSNSEEFRDRGRIIYGALDQRMG
jgi:hypothetical protein